MAKRIISNENMRRRATIPGQMLAEILDRVCRIERLLLKIEFRQRKIARFEMARFDNLIAQVERTKGIGPSIEAAFRGFQQQLSQVASQMNDEEDQRKVEELASELQSTNDRIVAAVNANPGPGEGGQGGGGNAGGGQQGGGQSAGRVQD